MIGVDDLAQSLADLGLERSTPVIVHASLSAFGPVQGGAPSVVEALRKTFDRILAPVFTYKTMLVPEVGPPDNAVTYGAYVDQNKMAEFFQPDMPADRLMGAIAETLRRQPDAERSMHPILSFAGVNALEFLHSQTINEPLAPIGRLADANGWVLLMGVDHTVNTSIHYAERLAGRKQFIRWALTPQGVQECPRFPGCSDGFDQIAPYIGAVTRRAQAGQAWILAIPLKPLISAVCMLLGVDPLALLCDHSYCERCQAVQSEIHRLQHSRK